ncbi:MAG: hypothetical protein M1840_000948 [Geoglossum simile]|nr:MAG: hypothetical protein M1840_000948 [Geoglossum simile]
MTTTRRQYDGSQIMTEYSRLRHPSSSESEISPAAPGATITPNGKTTFNGHRKKKSQRPENQVPTAHINYTQSPMVIERGDWVVRLREGDPAAMAKLDESDIWDGPFHVIELPPATNDESDNEKVIHRVKLRFPSGSKGDPWTAANRLIPVYPEPPRPEDTTSSVRGVIFHLRKGSSTFVELQRFRPRGKRGEELYIVGRLRDRRATSDKAETEYLVHWAGWPSEDDSWEKVDGIPEPFRKEHDRAKSGKNIDAGSKTPKAKKLSDPRDSSIISTVKDKTPGSRKKPSSSAATTAIGSSGSATAGRGAGTRQQGFGSGPHDAIVSVWRDTPPARAAVGAGRRTPRREPIGAPTPESSPPTLVPATPASHALGKRNRTRADHQIVPAETLVGKRRRV